MPFPPYPALPAPRTWTPGPVFTGYLRDDVANAVAFLANRPSFLAACTTGPSITSGGETVPLDTESWDTWAGHWQNSADPAFWFATQPGALGYYLAEGYVPFNYTSTSEVTFNAGLQYGTVGSGGSLTSVWGERHPVGSGHFPGPFVADLVPLTTVGAIAGSGSAAAMIASQNSGSGVSLATGAGPPRLSLRWVCALTGVTGLPVPANPPWPTPPAYITSGGWLNPAIRDTINYLIYPPTARVIYKAGSYMMPSGTFPAGSPVPLDTPTIDNYSGFTKASNGWTVPRNGVYYLYGQNYFAAASANADYSTGFSIAGGTTQWGGAVQAVSQGQGVCVAALKRIRLTAGQTVQLMGAQSTGSALQLPNTDGAPQSRLIAVWESA